MDEWEVDTKGHVKLVAKNKEQDIFYSIDAKGNRVATCKFKYGTIKNLSTRSANKIKYQVLEVKGDNEATKLFEFLATPENFNLVAPNNVEWSKIMTGEAGSNGLNFLTTSHFNDHKVGMSALFLDKLIYGFIIRGKSHNHPNNNPNPSGTGSSNGDIPTLKMMKERGNIDPNAVFNIFTPGNAIKYNNYDENSTLMLKEVIIRK